MSDPPPYDFPSERPEQPRPSWLRTGAVLALLAGALILGAVLALVGQRLTPEPVEQETPETVLRPTVQVLVGVRDLALLQTAEYHMERVIDLRDRQQRLFGLVQSEDAILLVASGEVTAGVDLSLLRDEDVQVDAQGTVTLTLPPPSILSTRLDNERTYVHTRSTDTLARRSQNLETRARQEAERTLEQAALDAGIMERAKRNAHQAISALLRSLGHQDPQIAWHPG